MHQALLISDIVAAILNLSGDVKVPPKYHSVTSRDLSLPIDYLPRRALAINMALTCRAFRDSALDVLWECVDDFSSLIGLLPEDLVDRHDQEQVPDPYATFVRSIASDVRHTRGGLSLPQSFRRLPTEEDLVAFRDRAKRVRVLSVFYTVRGSVVGYGERTNAVDVSVIRALAEAYGPKISFFPALQQLKVFKGEVRFLTHIFWLLSPQLRSLQLNLEHRRLEAERRYQCQLEAALRMLPSSSPRIRQLDLRVTRPSRVAPHFQPLYRFHYKTE